MEPESYLEIAVTKWLPRRWEDVESQGALDALGALFEKRHGDPWLHDILAARRTDWMSDGLAALAAAVRANLADDWEDALSYSAEAARELRAARSEAGALRADLEEAYALHRSVQSAAKCVEKAFAVEQRAQIMKYTWILTQVILEQGNCRSLLGDSGTAHRDMARALELARATGYRDLELRAAGILSNARTLDGNVLGTWNLGRAGLATYWTGPYSGVRAQQIYFYLVLSAESLGLGDAAFVLQREAARAIAETPRRRIEVRVRAHLAELAMRAGRAQEAKAEFDRAAWLLEQAQGLSDLDRSRAGVYRAQSDVAAGAPEAALRLMEAARPSVEKTWAVVDRLAFHDVFGDLLWRTGRAEEAEAVYREAIKANEFRLRTHQGFRDRASLMVAAAKAYRGLVEILWDRGNVAGAARLWEWFRAGEHPRTQSDPDFEWRREQIHGESFLSYAVLPGGVVVWLFDERSFEGWRLTVPPEELEPVASRFLRECADAGSDLGVVHRDARQLYDWLVAPLADRLDRTRTLVIEPDGPVGTIPMQALMDNHFQYLGEQFPIVICSGLADYQKRKSIEPVNRRVKALVVASPTLGEETARTFPPLVGTMLEGQSVANRFRNPMLLTGRDATIRAVEERRAQTELFHFSGHGFSNGGNGGLLLSPDGDVPHETGVLDGARMANQNWSRCRLAVLSACSTGTGETGESVNPESLVRGLLWTGIARVVASRWNIDSETGVRFMNEFYTELLSSADIATALQNAGRRLREDRSTSHPYYWAGFQGFGTR